MPTPNARPFQRYAACLALLALGLTSVPAAAQDADDEAPVAESASPFGVGFQASWPAYGLSGLYDVNEQITAQAVLGFLGTVTSFTGRGIYRFQREDLYNLYGFGEAGVLSWSGATRLDDDLRVVDRRENVLGIGGGAGIELDLAEAFASETDTFPPLFASLEIGLTFSRFEYYNLSLLGIGGGIHYRF